jgi:hypothetical protein
VLPPGVRAIPTRVTPPSVGGLERNSHADERYCRPAVRRTLTVMRGALMWWILGGGVLITVLGMLAPTWRSLLRSRPIEARDSAAVYWAQHSSSHG